jgi:hypothetical protein
LARLRAAADRAELVVAGLAAEDLDKAARIRVDPVLEGLVVIKVQAGLPVVVRMVECLPAVREVE